MDTPKPIGYWLKHLHNLMERQFEAALADLDMGRRHWQVLNVLYGGARTPTSWTWPSSRSGTATGRPWRRSSTAARAWSPADGSSGDRCC
ncbi:hypothetical protein GCM10029992_42960 [Glycomyces albus]